MCGRYTLATTPEILCSYFDLALPGAVRITPHYNIAPTQDILAVRAARDQPAGAIRHELVSLRWGLIPSWARNPMFGNPMINARAETLHEKPAFRAAFKRRRCLLPASGFYEWRKRGARKQPYYIGPVGPPFFAFAGLWESWTSPDGNTLASCTIITMEPNELMAQLHDRMPLILSRESFGAWLDPALEDTSKLTGLLRPYPADGMFAHEVSTLVNSPANNNPRLIEKVSPLISGEQEEK